MGRPSIVLLLAVMNLTPQELTFKTGISIVEIDASVFDDHGVVEALKQGDFVLKDNGQPVSLRYCELQESPLDLLFLVELSKMMRPNRDALRAAAEVAMAAVREGDRLGAITFGEDARLELPLMSDLKEARRRLRFGMAYAAFAGKPFVLSALSEAVRYQATQQKSNRRRAILMLTANTGFGLTDSHAAVTKELWNADAVLGGVVLPTSWTRLIYDPNPYRIFGMMNMPEMFPRNDYIDGVAQNTGGEIIYTADAGTIKATPDAYLAVRHAIERMRKRYRLYYTIPEAKAGQTRHVRIELSKAAQLAHPDAKIMGRSGYIVPKHDSAAGR